MRMIDDRKLSPAQKRQILERDEYQCGYCGAEAVCVDHIVPWSYTHDDHPDNLLAACWLCNGIAGNKLFETISEKRTHVLKRVEELLKKRRIAIWLREDVEALGRTLRAKVAASSIVVDDPAELDSVRAHVEKLGLLTC